MKAITLEQWDKMKPRAKSWITCRVLGRGLRVYWHCYTPSGVLFGGSHQDKRRCDDMLETANELTEKSAKKHDLPWPHPLTGGYTRPSASFNELAQHDHCAISTLLPILEDSHLVIEKFGDQYCISSDLHEARACSLAEAAALLLCKEKGAVK